MLAQAETPFSLVQMIQRVMCLPAMQSGRAAKSVSGELRLRHALPPLSNIGKKMLNVRHIHQLNKTHSGKVKLCCSCVIIPNMTSCYSTHCMWALPQQQQWHMPVFLVYEMQCLVPQKFRHALADGNCIPLHGGLKIMLAHMEQAQTQDLLSPAPAVS